MSKGTFLDFPSFERNFARYICGGRKRASVETNIAVDYYVIESSCYPNIPYFVFGDNRKTPFFVSHDIPKESIPYVLFYQWMLQQEPYRCDIQEVPLINLEIARVQLELLEGHIYTRFKFFTELVRAHNDPNKVHEYTIRAARASMDYLRGWIDCREKMK
jgi:hypothetical protein